jgi:hypothetical protein
MDGVKQENGMRVQDQTQAKATRRRSVADGAAM